MQPSILDCGKSFATAKCVHWLFSSGRVKPACAIVSDVTFHREDHFDEFPDDGFIERSWKWVDKFALATITEVIFVQKLNRYADFVSMIRIPFEVFEAELNQDIEDSHASPR